MSSTISNSNFVPVVAIAAATGIGGVLGYLSAKSQFYLRNSEVIKRTLIGCGLGFCLATATRIALTQQTYMGPTRYFEVNGHLETRRELTENGALMKSLLDFAQVLAKNLQ
jgi:hypothetical protein